MTIASDATALARGISTTDGVAGVIIARLPEREQEILYAAFATATAGYTTTTRTASLEEAWDDAVAASIVAATGTGSEAAAITAITALTGVYPVWD